MTLDERQMTRSLPLGVDRILLEPANPAFRPIVLDATSGAVVILGKVVGVIRRYGV